jgi:DNA-binding NarL/FixJ family response regulator
MLELVIVDDHPAVRSGLRGLLEDEEGLRVVATAASAREGFDAIADLRPDVALLDLHLPDDDGLHLCLRTRALPDPPRAVIYSAFADAVLAKSASPRALIAVLRGELRPSLDPRALRALGERLEPPDLAILGMLAHGVPEREMAATLGLTDEQALTRRVQMLARLDAGRRPLAAA